MRALKVYGACLARRIDEFPEEPRHHAQVRAIVAVRTRREGATAFRMSLYEFDKWTAETGNTREIDVACAEPGVVFVTPLDGRRDVFVARREP